ncbi:MULTISPECIES: hypothetical protein [unclassified Microcystis]|jgi:hypothetical protein|uniref:hypothetical protein n=1 Tax=unclassified Microcystis TaxID=2643300 RepID=UPI0022C4E609|nr:MULTISPECIES: hypothetical protein [unclassified Microcystis]MCZ8047662.1 hypothetical protein [Microcystis sp. LE19-41.2A]
MTTTVQRLSELNFASLSPAGGLFPSPITWEDQTFYFLMLDRFSDGRENGYKDNEGNLVRSGTTPPYSPAGAENAVKTEADAARAARSRSQICGRDAQGVREQNRLSETIGGDGTLD